MKQQRPANKVKKIIRGDYDHDPRVMELVLEEVAMELGDTLWYLAVLADELDVDLSVVVTIILINSVSGKKKEP